MAKNTENITIRLPADIQKKLNHVATDLDRSRNWLINEAIEHYLDVYDWQKQKIKDRLKKSEKGGKFRKNNQVEKIVESFKP